MTPVTLESRCFHFMPVDIKMWILGGKNDQTTHDIPRSAIRLNRVICFEIHAYCISTCTVIGCP